MMLLNFTCSNFRSFRDEQTITMIPGQTKNHRSHMLKNGNLDLLSVSAIFGANASGKSNIFKAMRFSRNFILGLKIDKQSFFRIDSDYEDKASTFEYEFSIGNRLYRYGFQIIISKQQVMGEWLFRISDDDTRDDELLFQRPLANTDFPLNQMKIKRRSSKFLILTLIDELRSSKDPGLRELLEVRDWFDNNLKIISTDDNYLHGLDYTDEECEELGRLLRDFDIGVNTTEFKLVPDSRITEPPIIANERVVIREHYVMKKEKTKSRKDSKDIPKKHSWVLVNNHGNNKELFTSYDESDGTRRLMELAPIIISSESDITYVVDELDRSLHPMAVYEFVRRFATKRAFDIPKQLIFTTHQTCLLDQDLLRRDEIWFVTKNSDGHSDLYSLDDYNERFDKNIEKMYLGGRYDGIPRINREEW